MNPKDLDVGDGESGFYMMQHLINEMDRSSQRIDEYNTEELYGACARAPPNDRHHIDLLYDEAWKSEDSDAASLKEVPLDFFDKGHGDSGCEDAVTSAIAEVSKDFLAGLRASAAHAQAGDSDESSHLSSDTEFRLIKGMPAYARYPETAAGLSDNDWNPYGTESDTNISPRINSQETPCSRLSALTSFNPPLHSTDLNAATPSSIIGSIPNTGTRMQGIEELSELDTLCVPLISLKPDVTADFSSISHLSEQTFGSQIAPDRTEPVRPSDLNKTMRDAELEDLGTRSKSKGIAHLQRELEDLKRSSSMDVGHKHLATSKGSSDATVMEGQYLSVMDRAKMLGIPGDIVDGKINTRSERKESKADGTSDRCFRKGNDPGRGDTSDEDYLGKKVKKVLSDTKYLERENVEKKTMVDVAIDYHSLQKDLQEIQDSLHHNFGSGTASTIVPRNIDGASSGTKSTPPSSDNDGDIIPSTTTTPDKKRSANRMAWDFGGDLASGHVGGYMEEVSLNTQGYSSGSQRQSAAEKQSYNSDGDDTRTSGSSDKVEDHADHAAADQALAEMSAILRPHPQLVATAAGTRAAGGPAGRDLNSSQDVDQMLSDFRDQRRELESRYQQLSNPGLADKVFRILTSQDPEAQADGILSRVNDQEREDRTRYALGLRMENKDLNFSSTDTDNPNNSGQSFSLPDDVIRRKLDLSGLSSADGSRLGDKSSFALPSSKGFSAFDGMTKFLSAQMAKASERTFNHSLEMQLPPQVVTCYPLFADTQKTGSEEKGEATAGGALAAGTQSEDILSGHPEESQPTATSSPFEPAIDAIKGENNNRHSSPEDSDSSSGKRKEKYRPYRPAGSKDFYYTESDAASVADSVTTVESTHIGSDDARGPVLPSTVLGSRKEAPASGGIYAKHKAEGTALPPIQEKSISDDRDSEPNLSSRGSADSDNKATLAKETSSSLKDSNNRGSRSPPRQASDDRGDSEGIRVHAASSSVRESSYSSRSVAAARRDAQWENRMRERDQDYQTSSQLGPSSSDFTNVGASVYSQRPSGRGMDAEESGAYLLTPDGFEPTESTAVKDFRMEEPVSVRVKVAYTDDADKGEPRNAEERRGRYVEGEDWREQRQERYLREESREGQEREQRRSGSPVDRFSSANRFDRAESPTSRYIHLDRDDMAYRREFHDRDSPTLPGRDARLSPAFHRALSADLRQAIEARSPLLSRGIERSLAQAPLEVPTKHRWQDGDTGKDPDLIRRSSSSPPPTFLARERGQSPRDYRHSHSHSPLAASRRTRSPSPPRVARREQALPEQRSASPTQSDRFRSLPSEAWAEQRGTSPPRLSSIPSANLAGDRSPTSYLSQTHHQERASSPSQLSRDRRSRSTSPGHERRYTSPDRERRSRSPAGERRQAEPNNVTSRDPRVTPTKSVNGQQSSSLRQSSPHRHVERTLENMSSESEDTEIDREPMSRRAQMLTAALPHEHDVSPDINALWDRFRALNESHESSMNSSRIEAVTELLRNPSQHLITQYLKEREEYRIERQERAEADRERRLKGQQAQLTTGRNHLHSSSEDDFNGGHIEMLAKKEEERLKRRVAKKKKGGGKPAEPGKATRHIGDGDRNKENIPDSLFSIPEDAGSEHSPMKGSLAAKKSKSQPKQNHQVQAQQQHVIDPNMHKLREKISRQRGKIDKQTLKEYQRVEKLKKLEHLLSAKAHDEISDQTLAARLGEISSTSTPGSNSSQENDNNGNRYNDDTRSSEDSTTAKDSSAEMHAWKAEKERRVKEMNHHNHQQQQQMAEMERRKEFKSSSREDTGRMKGKREMDKNTNRRVSSTTSLSQRGDASELRLLKMVREGYLSADEAYRVAMERTQQKKKTDGHADVSSGSLSSSDDHSFSGRPHRMYSPYSRQDEFSEMRFYKHVPKLKQLSPTQDRDDFRQRFKQGKFSGLKAKSSAFGAKTLPEPSRSTSPEYMRGKGEGVMPSSRSPSSRQHARPALSLKSYSPPRPSTRGRNDPPRRAGLSPQRLHHRHHHQHQRQNRGERYPTRHESKEMAAPQPKGISWKISMDVHPSKWEEPQSDKTGMRSLHTNISQHERGTGRVRQELPLPPLSQQPATLEEGEEPLQRWEKHADDGADFWCKADHPQGIPQELWEQVVSSDALASKANHWEVDPLMDRVQYILNKEPAEEEPASNMTLQDAFLMRNQTFISRCRERQRRIALAREDRHLQECLRLEREAIFAEQDRPLAPNLLAHPVSENLYHPKRRVFSKNEMKSLTERRYKKLQEVVQKQEKQKSEAEVKLNRLRVRMFNKKVQKNVLRKPAMRRR